MSAAKPATKAAAVKTANAENAPVRARRERVAALVLPTFSLKVYKQGDSFAVRMDSEIITKLDIDHDTGEVKKVTKGANKGDDSEIHLVQVTDLDTGARGEMLLPFIMHKALAAAGPLAGRCFEMVKGKENTGKATMWEVYEVAA